jgi:Zn-dependent M16 (insulinase) family peptidase
LPDDVNIEESLAMEMAQVIEEEERRVLELIEQQSTDIDQARIEKALAKSQAGDKRSLQKIVNEHIKSLKSNPWLCREEIESPGNEAFKTIADFEKLWQRVTNSTNLLAALLSAVAQQRENTSKVICNIQNQLAQEGVCFSLRVRIDQTAGKRSKSSSVIFTRVAVHPLQDNIARFLNLRVPACITLPRGEYFVLEGLFFEAGKSNQVGKRI